MLASSPLASLHAVLLAVRASAQLNASLLRKNEAATRAALIDPVLRALGWDMANVQMVEPERTVENKQILDYVLKDTEGNIQSIVEAKKLDESLDKLGHIGAAIGYAFSLKPKNFFITDGLHWHYYSPNHSNFHPVETINLCETHPVEAALSLIRWLDAAHSGYGIKPPVSTSQLEAIVPSEKLTKSVAKLPQLESVTHNGFVELAQIHKLQLEPGQKPKQLRLPDGSVVSLKTWKDILEKVCEFALKHNPSIPIPYHDKAGKKTFLLSVDKPLLGVSKPVTYLGKPIFIYTNYSAKDCIANALHALKLAPSNSQQIAPAVTF